MTLPTIAQIAEAQRSSEVIPQLNGILSPAEYQLALRSGITFGSTVVEAAARGYPGDRIIDTADVIDGSGFWLDGPFGPVIALYLRNPLNGTIGFYLGNSVYPITVGPESQRRLEFSTPTDVTGPVQRLWVEPVILAPPDIDGSVYIGLEP